MGIALASKPQMILLDEPLAGLAAAVVFGEFRDEHLVQPGLPGLARQLADQVVGTVAGLRKAEHLAPALHRGRHVEQRFDGLRIVREIYDHLEAIDVEDAGREVAPAPGLVLVEELQSRLDDDPALEAVLFGANWGQPMAIDGQSGALQWIGPSYWDMHEVAAYASGPTVADLDGDGYDEIGVRQGNEFLLDLNGNGRDDLSVWLPCDRVASAAVSAGAKALLDIAKTLEVLETNGVPVVGYETDQLPAFFSRSSGRALDMRLDSPEEVAAMIRARRWLLSTARSRPCSTAIWKRNGMRKCSTARR